MTRRKLSKADGQVLQAYLRHITGYEVTEVKREFKVDEAGGRELCKETESTKYVPGDIRAAEFWLTNRLPGEWKPARLLGAEGPEAPGETGVVELPAVSSPEGSDG